mgnify:CR=1 FL=1
MSNDQRDYKISMSKAVLDYWKDRLKDRVPCRDVVGTQHEFIYIGEILTDLHRIECNNCNVHWEVPYEIKQ